MMNVRVLLFVTLAVWGLDCVGAGRPWSSPMRFFYKDMDVLDIAVQLQNVPPRTTDYIIFVQTQNCDSIINTEHYKQQGSSCIEPAKNDTIQRDELIHVSKKLTEPSVTFYIEIRISNKICSRKQIIDGSRDEHADENAFHKSCLSKDGRPCQINVDFGNKCEDDIDCRLSRGHFTCESTNKEVPDDTVHQWYQRYRDDSFIGLVPRVKGKKTKFKMELQKFDLNTYTYSILKSTQWKKDSNTEVVKIPLATNGYKEYHVSRSQSYSENKPLIFTCPNKAHTQVGWIDPTGYKIITYNGTSYAMSLMKIHNNSMLCCLHFNIYTNGYEATVERSVDDITVLIYKEPEKQENVTTNTPHKEHSSQDTSSLEPKAPRSTTPTKTRRDQQNVKPPDYTKYYIAIVSVAAIILLISLIYVFIKKCYRKSSDPEQTLQLETYASTNAVLYAELDISPGNAPPPVSAEDPTYAVIIGEIRPQNKYDKK